MEGHDSLLTTREVAALFRVDEKTIRRWVSTGKLTAGRTPTGRKLLFRESEIRALLAAQEGTMMDDELRPFLAWWTLWLPTRGDDVPLGWYDRGDLETAFNAGQAAGKTRLVDALIDDLRDIRDKD